jgi:hypothetical protein
MPSEWGKKEVLLLFHSSISDFNIKLYFQTLIQTSISDFNFRPYFRPYFLLKQCCRKSRAKPGRKPGPIVAEVGPSTPKRQKIGVIETVIDTSPAMNTGSQLALNKEVEDGTSQEVNTTMEVITTPRKKKQATKKKLTPKKANN